MSTIDRLFTQDVTLVRAGATTDRYGGTVKDWATATSTAAKGWVAQRTASEVLDGREAQVSGWVLFVGPDQDVIGLDRVEWAGQTFEVDGPVLPAYTPRGLHHIEVPLKQVAG